ncbi:hypothetical protein Bca101_058386 [Brassica carinata]
MPIPMDVVTDEILTRLPAKSLMRFKCVSKLFGHPSSAHHIPHCPNQTTPTSFHAATSAKIYAASFATTYGKSRVSLTLPPGSLSLYPLPSIPVLPKAPSPTLGHDPTTNQYKVVCSVGVRSTDTQEVRSHHRVFVLKSGGGGGGSWRKVNRLPPPDFIPHIAARGGVCIDGVIYYLGWTTDDNYMLVSFGIRSHDFKMIQVPRAGELPSPAKLKNVCLVEYGGKVTVVDQTNLKGMLDLWALENAASQKWLSKRLVLKPSQLDFFRNTEFVVRGFRNEEGDMRLLDEASGKRIWCITCK